MKYNSIEVILMAGGKGTRLRPFTHVLPKPLVPLGEISILEMVLKQLKNYGFKNIAISVGYKAEIIMAVIGRGERFDLNISYYKEDIPIGTIGSLTEINNLADDFIVMNGDICTNLNFMDFYNYHKNTNSIATIASLIRKDRLPFGILEINDQNKTIVGFKEKPLVEYVVSMGVNAFKVDILELIPHKQFFGFDDLMLKMIEQNMNPHYMLFNGLWYDVGRPDDYERMLESFENNPEHYLPK